MTIHAVSLWIPRIAEKGPMYKEETYKIGKVGFNTYKVGKTDVQINAIELSPTGEVVLVLANGNCIVFGDVPHRIELEPSPKDETASTKKG